jgi:UDP-N-acetylglucosamine 1-carboxyvinyltransferase
VRYRVRGGRPLAGRVAVRGAKNAALPILEACTLAARPCTIVGVPDLVDVAVVVAILRRLGARVEEGVRDGLRCLTVDPRGLRHGEVPPELMRRVRSCIDLMGPLLARFGSVRVSFPGGCVIGPRPIDLHLRGLERLGARVADEPGGFLSARAERLRGAEIYLDRPSVGCTEHMMMAAALAEGVTVIQGAAREPEVVDLAGFLQALGARVAGAGGDAVRVEGTGGALLGGCEYRIMPDRIEAGTLLCAAAATGGEVTVEGCRPAHLGAFLAKLREAGCDVSAGPRGDEVALSAPERPRPADVTTQPYPGFPTDLQNPIMAVLLRAGGTSRITETVFEKRFQVAEEFGRLGARVSVLGRTALVQGVPRLTGAVIEAGADLRGAAAMVVAALAAGGETVVERADAVARGYEDLAGDLRSLGADVEVLDDGP